MATQLSKRLASIWEKPNFLKFFENYSSRPVLKVKKGSLIFYEGDKPGKIFFIKSGFVKLFHSSESGKDAIIYLYGPNSVLGLRALTSQDELLQHSAEALTDTQVITLSREEYLKAMEEHPEYIVDLLHLFIDRLDYTERKLSGFILTDVTARVANFMINIANRFGEKSGTSVTIPLPLTHQRIAEFVGSFRETVTGSIQKLEKSGCIEFTGKTLTIKNFKTLEGFIQER